MAAYEAALAGVCDTVGLFLDEATGIWTVEGVKQAGAGEEALEAGLAVAEAASGFAASLTRETTEADGWLARTAEAFPEQLIGRRIAVRGTHLPVGHHAGRITLVLDAAAAFGSGEHDSTRGCLMALERVLLWHRPGKIVDLGTGTGILAMAAAGLTRRRVRATDIDPWAVRTARDNARRNRLPVSVVLADGWRSARVRAGGPYDLVLANILARPLVAMAPGLAGNLARGGVAILSGLLARQARWVLSAHRAQGLVLAGRVESGVWTTLILRRPPSRT